MKRTVLFLTLLCMVLISLAQQLDTSGGNANLQQCIQYALAHQTNIRQSQIDQQIADREIKNAIADWYPQIGMNANYQRNFQLPTSVFNNAAQPVGTYQASSILFGLNQTVFNRDVLLAKQSASDVRISAKQQTINTQIAVVTIVSKAFYDVLLSKEQINLLDADLILLQRSLKDAYDQYNGGLVDKTDYQRATISLNNAKSQRKTAEEQLKTNYAQLKLYMSYPSDSALRLIYDSAEMVREIASVDTTMPVDYRNRIEYQQLETQKRLELANLKYTRNAYLPSVSLFGEYNLNYYNDHLSKLYTNNYPNSYAGLALALPIFQGTKRTQQIRIAQLELDRLDYNFVSLKDSITTEYTQAIAAFKSNLTNYYFQKENLQLAMQVYNIIQLQYRSGIKTYLDVVTANDDLFRAQINYTNSLYQVLGNKVDVERASGTLRY
jgi:outer membrane protein